MRVITQINLWLTDIFEYTHTLLGVEQVYTSTDDFSELVSVIFCHQMRSDTVWYALLSVDLFNSPLLISVTHTHTHKHSDIHAALVLCCRCKVGVSICGFSWAVLGGP